MPDPVIIGNATGQEAPPKDHKMKNWTTPEAYLPQPAPKKRRWNWRTGNDWPLAFLIGSCIYLAL